MPMNSGVQADKTLQTGNSFLRILHARSARLSRGNDPGSIDVTKLQPFR
jgi:hypothetical protein